MTPKPETGEWIEEPTHIEVEAAARYWEDATVNGVSDDDGTQVPFRSGMAWCPRIELATGHIEGWPAGTVADIHYKVCDAGEYWLANASGQRIAKWRGCYVPSAFLCHGASGYGDYIILKVLPDGMIADYRRPGIDPDEWETLSTPERPQ